MEGQLFCSIQSNECGDGDKAAVALGETGSFPHIAEKNVLGKFG
jgi:hypothetical protein